MKASQVSEDPFLEYKMDVEPIQKSEMFDSNQSDVSIVQRPSELAEPLLNHIRRLA